MQQDLYARELRLQEDEIYRLEDCLEDCHAVIRRVREENADLKSRLEQHGESTAAAPRAEPLAAPGPGPEADDQRSLLDDPGWSPDRPPTPSPPAQPPTSQPPAAEEPPEVELPEIDGGVPANAPPFAPAGTPSAAQKPGPEPPPPPDFRGPSASPPVESLPPPFADPQSGTNRSPALASCAPVRQVELRAERGDDTPDGGTTLSVMAKPLDADGRPVHFAGAAGVLLRDPAAAEGRRTLAEWDFTAEEVASLWEGSPGEGWLALRVVLPASTPAAETPPPSAEWELWVRLIEAAGGPVLARTTLADAEPGPPGSLRQTGGTRMSRVTRPVRDGAVVSAAAAEPLPPAAWRAR